MNAADFADLDGFVIDGAWQVGRNSNEKMTNLTVSPGTSKLNAFRYGFVSFIILETMPDVVTMLTKNVRE